MLEAPQRLIAIADALSGSFDPQELAKRFDLDSHALSFHCLIASAVGMLKGARLHGGGLRWTWKGTPQDALEFAEKVLLTEARTRLG